MWANLFVHAKVHVWTNKVVFANIVVWTILLMNPEIGVWTKFQVHPGRMCEAFTQWTHIQSANHDEDATAIQVEWANFPVYPNGKYEPLNLCSI